MSHAEGPVFFDATLTPSRSLNQRGFVILMAVIVVFNAIVATRFVTLGLWPVLPFLGLDVAAIAFAFLVNYRAGRETEHIWLDRTALRVRSISAKGKARDWSFEPSWVRVQVDERARPRGRLTITSHGKGVGIAEFLSPRERRDIAKALGAALHQRSQSLALQA